MELVEKVMDQKHDNQKKISLGCQKNWKLEEVD
jgi:transcription termination factor NusB